MDELNQLAGALDSKWAHLATQLFIAAAIAGRIYKSLRNGGGLVGIWNGLLYGTNTPKPLDKPKTKNQVIETTDKTTL